MRLFPSFVALAAISLVASSARAESPLKPVDDIREQVPLVGLTTSAFGATARSVGAAGYGGIFGRAGAGVDTKPVGGGRVWGSPIDRLTIRVDIDQGVSGEVAPSFTVQGRIFGDRARGWALGALLSYRFEGFAEVAGEIEGGLLFSVARNRMHLDANVIVGGGIEEHEVDGEIKLRVGYDVTPWLRVGADSRFRYRLGGDKFLPGGRVGDGIGGPELLFAWKNFFLDLTGGPSTVAVVEGIGWTVNGAIGGALFF
ncbi:Hypothetical protein A7982_05630 [Minicystis rosea]|nr:Hypothetical protein A7982_05630 [Minicystis rosea]